MIQLYNKESCPFCIKVRRAFDSFGLQEGKDFTLVSAETNSPGREIVIQLGGKSQVPFLVHGDVKMYESDDIIEYVRKLKLL
jgi:glutaredoxin